MVSNIWWAQKKTVFKDKSIPPELTASCVLSMAEEFKENLKTQKTRCHIPPSIDFTIPLEYFVKVIHLNVGWE
jgi:hypothetical protein